MQAGETIALMPVMQRDENGWIISEDGTPTPDASQRLIPVWSAYAKHAIASTEIVAIEIVNTPKRNDRHAIITCTNGETYSIFSDATRYVTINESGN